MYQLIEKLIGNNQNFDFSKSPHNLSIIPIFRTEAFIKFSIEAPMIPTSRDFLTYTSYSVYLMFTGNYVNDKHPD